MKNILANFYLEFINEFLTIERFAAYHDMEIEHCQTLVNMGRVYHEERCTA